MEVKLKDLTKGSIFRHLIDLALPTVGGMIAFALFNVTDTYFVGKLGTEALAAMGFTFPVVMVAGSISTGVSVGAMALLSRAYGRNDNKAMKRITTDGILLSIAIVAVLSTLGLVFMDDLFSLLGASNDTLPMISEYMTVWFAGLIVVMMPPVCDGSMRAVGDTMRPFKVMLTCAILNIILDPIFIFGYLGVPAFGIKGAAIATFISRFVGMILTLYFNHKYHGLISWKLPKLDDMLQSWTEIIKIAIPSMGVSLLPQFIRVALTTLTAGLGGTVFVAAVAIGSRIEGFALIIAIAVGSSIVPLVGQNYGAGEFERVRDTQKLLSKSALIIGGITFVSMVLLSTPLIGLFTKDQSLIEISRTYIMIVALGTSGLNLYNFNSQLLNAIGMPSKSFIINGIGTLLIIVPLMYIGSLFSFEWMLGGLVAGQMIVGFGANIYVKRYSGIKELKRQEMALTLNL